MNLIRFWLFWLLPVGSLSAYYLGNGANPAIVNRGMVIPFSYAISVNWGVTDDWIYNIPFTIEEGGKAHWFHQTATGTELSLDFFQRASVFAYTAYCDTEVEWNQPNGNILYFKTTRNIIYDLGGKIVLFKWNRFLISGLGKYFHGESNVGQLVNNGRNINRLPKTRFHNSEWKLSTQLAYSFNYFVPYAGWFYQNTRSRLVHLPEDFASSENLTFLNREKNGIVAGVTTTNHKIFSLNLETRWIAETALGLNIRIKF